MATKKKEETLLSSEASYSTTPTTPTTATGSSEKSWGEKLNDIVGEIGSRKPFSYDLNGDALYQQYKDNYVQGGKMAMMDTIGQTTALTGGYGNSYAQGAGQQAYQNYLQGLNDIVPELYGMAYNKYNDEGNQLNALAQLYGNMDEQEYQRGQVELDRQEQNRGNVIAFIEATGQLPTAEQLAAAGLTEEEAQAYVKSWQAQNPDIAYRTGAITPEEYKTMTGKYPAGYTPTGGGGGGGNPGRTGNPVYDEVKTMVEDSLDGNLTWEQVAKINGDIARDSELTDAEKQSLAIHMDGNGNWTSGVNKRK